MAQDSDLCLAPVACDSPALALAQRPRLQLSHGVPHDSATSLVRLDMHLLPSPLSKGVSFAAMGKYEDPHASPDPHGSLNAHMWPSTMSDGQGPCVRKGLPPQLSLGTHAVPMIISPDDHHGMSCQVRNHLCHSLLSTFGSHPQRGSCALMDNLPGHVCVTVQASRCSNLVSCIMHVGR